jgi:hypothetical protein
LMKEPHGAQGASRFQQTSCHTSCFAKYRHLCLRSLSSIRRGVGVVSESAPGTPEVTSMCAYQYMRLAHAKEGGKVSGEAG